MRYVRAISLACACAALLVGTAGCGCNKKRQARDADADLVIATVDGREIRASALLAEYETVPAERRTYYAANRSELLDFIINRMVIVAEARAEGLEKDPEVLERLDEARRFALRMMLDKEMMRTLPPITDEQLRARYRQDVLSPAGPRIVTQAILYRIPTDEAGEDVIHETIRKSRSVHLPFGTLAKHNELAFTLVRTPLSPGSDMPPALVRELGALKIFTPTRLKVVRGKGVIFYKEPLPFEQAEPVVRAALLNEQLAKAREAWAESVRSKAEVATHPERFTADAADDEVLVTISDATISVADARRALVLMPPAARARYRADAARLVEYLVRNELLVQEAERRGFDSSDAFRARMRDATDGLLIRTMRERVLAKIEITISDEELRALAAEASGGDMPNEFIELYAITNPDRAQVEKALEDLNSGNDFNEVHAAYSTDKHQHVGTYSDTTIETMPEALRTATEDLKDGECSDVFEMDKRFLVVQVTRRPAVVNLEPWRRRLLARKQDEHFLNWVAEQRAKHRIVVNAKRLDEVQLPEAPSAAPTPPGPMPQSS